MTALPYTPEMIKEALAWSEELGAINNSITQGQGNVAGRLGELALAKYLNVLAPEDKYSHDISHKGETIEVKTKRRTVRPESWHDVSVAETSKHQKPNKYAFISLQFEGYEMHRNKRRYLRLQKIWYCGDSLYEDFWSRALKWEKGKVDASNNFTTHANMYNLRVDQLDNSLMLHSIQRTNPHRTIEEGLDPFDL